MSDWRKKNAVYIVTIPESFKPKKLWDLPEATTGAELFAKNVLLIEAQDFCRVFNKRQMEAGLVEHKWALAIKHTRCRWTDHSETEIPNDSIPPGEQHSAPSPLEYHHSRGAGPEGERRDT